MARLVVFDYNKPLQRFLKDNKTLGEQYLENASYCFINDSYHLMSAEAQKKIPFEKFQTNIFKTYFCKIQTLKEKKELVQEGKSFQARVFAYESNELLFSCTLEVNTRYVEIHDVCVGSRHGGKGLCKKYIMDVCKYIKDTYKTQNKIKIVCDENNIPACKCYTSIFGEPKVVRSTRDGFRVKQFELRLD
jgi:c-di-GMP-related signal transduction protein